MWTCFQRSSWSEAQPDALQLLRGAADLIKNNLNAHGAACTLENTTLTWHMLLQKLKVYSTGAGVKIWDVREGEKPKGKIKSKGPDPIPS